MVDPKGQLGLSVAAAAALRAQITAKEIQLAAMRSFATDDNPQLRLTLQELASLRTELAKMERNATSGQGDVMVPFGKAPEVGLEYVRHFREVKYQETLFEALARQYEIARIDEARDATLIQLLDPAIEPERKSKPKRLAILLIVSVLAVAVGSVLALVLEFIGRRAEDASVSAKLAELRSLLLPKR